MKKYVNVYQSESINIFCVYMAMAGAVFIYKIHEKESTMYTKRGWMKYYNSRTVIIQTKEKTDNTNGTTTV